MKAILILHVGWVVISTSRAEDSVKKALAQLRGTWEVVKAEGGRLKAKGFTFSDDRVVVETEDGKKEAPLKLDPSAKPFQIDLGEGERTNRGIYKIEGDNLMICLAGFNAKRPAEFKQTEDTLLLTLKRGKR